MNLFQRFSFTALNLPTSAAGMPMFIFILPFYADDLGLGLSLVGIIFLWQVYRHFNRPSDGSIN